MNFSRKNEEKTAKYIFMFVKTTLEKNYLEEVLTTDLVLSGFAST